MSVPASASERLPLLPEFVTVDTHFPGFFHAPPGTYAQPPCSDLPAQYSISSSRPGAAVRGRVSLRVAYFHVRLAAAGHPLVALVPALTPRASLPPISLPPCSSSPPVMGRVLFCDRRQFNASGLKRLFGAKLPLRPVFIRVRRTCKQVDDFTRVF